MTLESGAQCRLPGAWEKFAQRRTVVGFNDETGNIR